MAEQAKRLGVGVDEYLRGERAGEVRHEFVNGDLYAMTGASRAHNRIALNLAVWLRDHGQSRGCEVFIGDVKVHIADRSDERFYYPDVMLVCEADAADDYFVERPCLVVELLSPTKERAYRSDKFFAYRRLTSLQEIVLIAQDTYRVEVYRRRTGWNLEVYGARERLRLDCVEAELGVGEVYAGGVVGGGEPPP